MTTKEKQYRVGLISDTHGILQPRVVDLFAGCDRIIHAGDIDTPEILARLQRIAPVVAVRGNMDRGRWAGVLPLRDVVTVGEISVYVVHDIGDLDLEPVPADIEVVISGHTHNAQKKKLAGVLYINPGSAGMPRSGRPPGVALLHVNGCSVTARLIDL